MNPNPGRITVRGYLNEQKKRIYVDRIVGGDFDYRASDGDAAAVSRKGSGAGAGSRVPVESQAMGYDMDDVRRRERAAFSGDVRLQCG